MNTDINKNIFWEKPNRRYFKFLKMIKNNGMSLSLCVLGAADGNYVIPAAKLGYKVVALENDKVSLYGGQIKKGNIVFKTKGLFNNISDSKLTNKVEVVDTDYVTSKITQQFSGVFTSGSIHYQQNSKYPLKIIINRIQNYCALRGILLLEYIHRSRENSAPHRHFVTSEQIKKYFQLPFWKITSNKKKVYVEPPNPRNNKTHRIVWGRLYATKLVN